MKIDARKEKMFALNPKESPLPKISQTKVKGLKSTLAPRINLSGREYETPQIRIKRMVQEFPESQI
jgi:hypothetical protein